MTVDFCDRNAEHFPEKEALVDSKVRLTWSQAKLWIDRMALYLIGLNFKKDDVLLAQLYNSVDLVLIRLACEKAGILLAMVPYTFRHAELKAVLKNVEAKGAFIPYEYRGFNYFGMFKEICSGVATLQYLFVVGDQVPEEAISIKSMTQQALGEKYPEDFPRTTKFDSYGFEEIMTTNGSTGIPKCVEWAGCARLSQGREAIKRLRLAQNDIISPFYASTGGSAELLTYRCAPQVAAKTVMLEHYTPERACKLIEKERITVVVAVPALIVRLLDYLDLPKYDLSSLHLLICSAAHLPYEVAREAEERLGKIIQFYGKWTTEGSV